MRLKTTSAAVFATAGLAVGAPVAAAQTSPVQEGYSTPGGVVQTQVENGNPPPAPRDVSESSPAPAVEQPQPAASSELPFTGLDVGLVLAAGAMLLVAGFGIRRLSRSTGAA
jgi:hypothetical protein